MYGQPKEDLNTLNIGDNAVVAKGGIYTKYKYKLVEVVRKTKTQIIVKNPNIINSNYTQKFTLEYGREVSGGRHRDHLVFLTQEIEDLWLEQRLEYRLKDALERLEKKTFSSDKIKNLTSVQVNKLIETIDELFPEELQIGENKTKV